ncbi:MAG: T9SS type A sorting domain-containing protein [Cytophagales bacterium]|nr:T9SS type A sorting domain-containing protein [Cytophagales bacterium]
MKKTKLLLLTCLLTLMGLDAMAQRVVAYHQGFRNNQFQSWYWDYVTDVNYSFLQISSSGGVGLGADGNADPTQQTFFDDFIRDAKAQGKHINISVGGASKVQAERFEANTNTLAQARNLASKIVAFAKNNGLNGIDIDWEPENQNDQPASQNWINLMQALREEITSSAPTLELSAAVFPFKWNNDFVTPASYQYVDHFNIMVYDFGGDYAHHSLDIPAGDREYGGQDVEVACINYWTNVKGLDKTKMVLGLPFYGRSANWSYSQNDYKLYRDILALGGSATADAQGQWRYNGQTTIKRKTSYAITNGLKGVMMWEVVGDATTKDKSLLVSIDEEITAAGCPKPNLGEDQNICGIASIELDASLAATDYTFKWYKNNSEISGATGKTYEATAPGAYKVVATKKGSDCFQENVAILTDEIGEIPTLSDASLCGGAAYEADATVPGFDGVAYSWSDGSSTVGQESKLSVTSPGTYTVTVSDPQGHCDSKTASFTASENNIDVQFENVCNTGDEAHYVIQNADGNYGWYTAETGGNLLGNETELYKAVDGQPVWVQKTGGATNYTVGLAIDNEEAEDDFSGPGNGDYNTAGGADLRLQFDVLQELTITQFTARVATKGDIDVIIYDESGKALQTETVNLEWEGEYDFPVNFKLSPGRYFLGMPDAQQWAQKNPVFGEDIGYGTFGGEAGAMDLDGVIDFISSNCKCEGDPEYGLDIANWYAGFYNIVVSTGQVCPRVSFEAVVDENDPKCATFAPDVTITAPDNNFQMETSGSVTLEANATDSDGTVETVRFIVKNEGGSTVKTLNATENGGNWTATLEDLDAGTYTVIATATDDDSETGESDAITITVGEANNIPTITFITPNDGDKVPVGQNVGLSVNVSDADGKDDLDKVVYTIKDGQGGLITELTNTDVDFLFYEEYAFNDAGTYTIEAKVTDKKGGSATATVSITIEEENNEDPIVVINEPANTSVKLPNTVNFDVTATDNDGSIQSVTVEVNGESVQMSNSGSSYTGTWDPANAGEGTYTATIKVTDNKGGVTTKTVTITILAEDANLPPTIVVTAPVSSPVTILTTETLDISATITDEEGTVQSVTIDGENVSGSGDTYATTFSKTTAGTYSVDIVATDNEGASSTKTIEIIVEKPNEAPIVTIDSPSNGATVVVTKGDNTIPIISTITDDVTVSNVVVTVNGKTIAETNSGDTYTANYIANAGGDVTVVVTATDNKGVETSETITFTVDDQINSDSDISIELDAETVRVDEELGISVIATDDEGIADVSITVTDNSDQSVEDVNSSTSGSSTTGTWTPNKTGSFTITVTVTDNKGNTYQETKTITVSEANQDPTITLFVKNDGKDVEEGVAVLVGTVLNLSVDANDDGPITKVYYKIEHDGTQVSGDKITGTKGDDFATTWTASAVGEFTISAYMTDSDGIKVFSNEIVVTVDVQDAIAEANAAKMNYTVYPNPANDITTISFDLEESANTSVVVYNAQGQAVSSVVNAELNADTHTFDIDASELPSGLYFIQLIANDTLAIQRLIVE